MTNAIAVPTHLWLQAHIGHYELYLEHGGRYYPTGAASTTRRDLTITDLDAIAEARTRLEKHAQFREGGYVLTEVEA